MAVSRAFHLKCVGRERSAFAAALAVVLSACSVGAAQWRQGPPIELPHTVMTLDALRLRIDVEGEELRYDVDCVGTDTYPEVMVTAEARGGTTSVTGASVACKPGDTLLRGSLGRLDDLETGDKLQIGLVIQPAPGYEGGVKESVLYMMGTDGRLRRGAESVWR